MLNPNRELFQVLNLFIRETKPVDFLTTARLACRIFFQKGNLFAVNM